MDFNKLWQNYPGASYSSAQVYQLIGGKVLFNHTSNPTVYRNSCALRLSRALNYGGHSIPYISKQTGSGEDKKWYFYRVGDLKRYLSTWLGEPTVSRKPADRDYREAFKDKSGIIVFEVEGWGDATGHITLWNGNDCGDQCYFDQNQGGAKTKKVSLWMLREKRV